MAKEKFLSLHIYTDGGAMPNPGNSAYAFTIYDKKGNIVSEKVKFIGSSTNNIAEYTAVINALDEASRYSDGKIFCFSDSERVVKQLSGREKSKKLKELFLEVKIKEKKFKHVTYTHKQEKDDLRIARVDRLIKKELKSRSRK